MKTKKIVLRSCCVTKEKLPKGELIRIVRTPDGNVLVDVTGKQNGRGAYIKKSLEVLEKAKKTNVLSKQLEVEIKDEVYEAIKEEINK